MDLFSVHVDAKDWYGLSQDIKRFDPALMRRLRKDLRSAGSEGVDGVREKLGESSPDGGPDTGRNRSLLAAGTRVAISFAKRGGSVKITTTASQLPAEHKAILAAYNTKGMWRHPTFGEPNSWVAQLGRPYFYGPVMKAGSKRMSKGIEAAIDDAVRAIGAR
jgi:hypothetical protein